MKNRDRYWHHRNEYDILCQIQTAIASGVCGCVIEALIGRDYDCKGKTLDDCKFCIQLWLNSED